MISPPLYAQRQIPDGQMYSGQMPAGKQRIDYRYNAGYNERPVKLLPGINSHNQDKEYDHSHLDGYGYSEISAQQVSHQRICFADFGELFA